MQSTFPQLSDFSHRGLPRSRDPRARLAAFIATVAIYGLIALLAMTPSTWLMPLKELAPTREAVVRLLPSSPPHMAMQDFNIRLIRPKAENAPMPEFVIKPDVAPAPAASLPVTAALNSPMAGGAAPGSRGGAISGVGTGGSGTGMAGCIDPAYLEAIKRHTKGWYDYPVFARKSGITGVVYVHFVIDKSGHYKQLNIGEGSGNDVLDEAALRTMRRAEPLPSIPDRFHLDQFDGLFPIIYQRNDQPLTARHLGSGPSGC